MFPICSYSIKFIRYKLTKKSLEKPNEKGQIVIPFYTHEGSGLSDTENHLKEACSGATIAHTIYGVGI
ncbi:hypothetical protein DXA01_12945 [Bacteroides caccae]|nr:hypothetical protein DXA01_12945 [Bacteroides caccae]